jgi:hypothetical protein
MKSITASELRNLIAHRNGPCVSLYMPTHISGGEVQQDPIRLKNLVSKAEAELAVTGMKPADAAALLAPVRALVDDGLFWRHHDHALVFFIGDGYFVHHRLPAPVDELVTVTDRFSVKPLLRLFLDDERFMVLALSQNGVRIFEGTRFAVHERAVEGLPANLAETLRKSVHERQLLFHAGAQKSVGHAGSVHYGTGPGSDDAKENIVRFFREVDKAIHEYLREKNTPLVLAGVEYLLPLYRQANSYAHLVDGGVPGNPESVTIRELHERAVNAVEPLVTQRRRKATGKYMELAASPRASIDPLDSLRGAVEGRMDTLLVDDAVQCWGTFNSTTGDGVIHDVRGAGDIDLLDVAAVETVMHGGTVHVLPSSLMPNGAVVASVFRF